MDYNKFEDRISDWIENSMDIKERKEFEKYLAENPEHKKKVDDVRNAMNIMKTAPSLKTSDNFDIKLQDRINALNDKLSSNSANNIKDRSNIDAIIKANDEFKQKWGSDKIYKN